MLWLWGTGGWFQIAGSVPPAVLFLFLSLVVLAVLLLVMVGAMCNVAERPGLPILPISKRLCRSASIWVIRS